MTRNPDRSRPDKLARNGEGQGKKTPPPPPSLLSKFRICSTVLLEYIPRISPDYRRPTTIVPFPPTIFRIQAGYLDSLPDRLGRDSVADIAISHLPSLLLKLNDSRNVFLGLSP